MLIMRIGAGTMSNGSRVAETCQHIDMAIGVITHQFAMFQPENALNAQKLFKLLFDVCQGELGITARMPQTGAGGEQGSFAIRVDAATF